jgi:large subunit ribosomal protein L35
MPKLKTHKGMAKRIKVTGGGKLLQRHANRGHMLNKKQASLKREYVKESSVSSANLANIKKMIGA